MDLSIVPVAEPVSRLIAELEKLPGIGPKTAQRLTYYILRQPESEVRSLAQALLDVKTRVRFCVECFNISEDELCPICRSPDRDRSVICVMEEPLHVLALERTGRYRGLYHVLHGVISPLNGILPENLRIDELVERVRRHAVREVILATNPNLEGDTTASYIFKLLAPLGVKVSRLARGLPSGGELDYADERTMVEAIEGRRALN